MGVVIYMSMQNGSKLGGGFIHAFELEIICLYLYRKAKRYICSATYYMRGMVTLHNIYILCLPDLLKTTI